MKTRRLQGGPARRSGQALVETVLVMPILLIMIIGVIDLANAWKSYQALQDATRLGARNAAIDNPAFDQTAVQNSIIEAIQAAGLSPARLDTPQIVGMGGGRDTETTILVTYHYQFQFLQPLIGWTGVQATLPLRTFYHVRNE